MNGLWWFLLGWACAWVFPLMALWLAALYMAAREITR